MDDKTPTKLIKAFESISNKITVFSLNYKEPNIISKIKSTPPNAIVLSGSDYRIHHEDSPHLPLAILKLNIPILGICYGFQWLIKNTKGGVCEHLDRKLHEYGKKLHIYGKTNIYEFKHHDYICDLKPNWKPLIYDETKKQIWMATNEKYKLTGIQFHPEKREASTKTFFTKWLENNVH